MVVGKNAPTLDSVWLILIIIDFLPTHNSGQMATGVRDVVDGNQSPMLRPCRTIRRRSKYPSCPPCRSHYCVTICPRTMAWKKRHSITSTEVLMGLHSVQCTLPSSCTLHSTDVEDQRPQTIPRSKEAFDCHRDPGHRVVPVSYNDKADTAFPPGNILV